MDWLPTKGLVESRPKYTGGACGVRVWCVVRGVVCGGRLRCVVCAVVMVCGVYESMYRQCGVVWCRECWYVVSKVLVP